MMSLEQYLDDQTEIEFSLFNKYEYFGYEDKSDFVIDLQFMLDNLYDIKMVDKKMKRLNQTEFRMGLIEKYGKCVVTGNDCLDELTAIHLIPVSEDENYDINNGLLLTENLHRTFDKYYWSINPNTLIIEINDNIDNVGSIKYYKDYKVDLIMNVDLYDNLLKHYNCFLMQ